MNKQYLVGGPGFRSIYSKYEPAKKLHLATPGSYFKVREVTPWEDVKLELAEPFVWK